METKKVTVPNISCGHCAHTIKSELSEIDGVDSVDVNVDSKIVTVDWQSPASWKAIETVLLEINYPPEEV